MRVAQAFLAKDLLVRWERCQDASAAPPAVASRSDSRLSATPRTPFLSRVGEKRVQRQQKNSETDKLPALTAFESRYKPGMTWRDLVQEWCPGADRRMADRILLRGTRWPFSQSLPVIEGQLAAVAHTDWRQRFAGE